MGGYSILRWLGAGAAALALACVVVALWPGEAACAADQPGLLIVGECPDKEAAPRNSRTFARVLAALANEMRQRGFTVYDENAVGIDIAQPGRVHRADAELISLAKRAPHPVDAVVAVELYASARKSVNSGLFQPQMRIAGRVVQVQT